MLDDLIARFRDRTRGRVLEMAALLEAAHSEETIERLARHFHGLSGLGATYGYPEISRLGDEGEELLIELVKAKRRPSAEELEKLRGLVEGVRREVE